MGKIKKATSWIHDYFYALGRHFLFYKPVEQYLWRVKKDKEPIVLIPGLFERHDFLSAFADSLSLAGHPIYFSKELGRNVKNIADSAKIIEKLILDNNLQNIIIVSHSKGGLIGKYLLTFSEVKGRIKKIITIATPWEGSRLFRLYLHKSFKELRPNSDIIEELRNHKEVNEKIVSIFGKSDNVIWPIESCKLKGAKNIEVNTYGHHKILFDKNVCDVVLSEI